MTRTSDAVFLIIYWPRLFFNNSCDMTFFLAGIIPWNATPGVACGAMLLEICNSSEVLPQL